MHTLLDSHSLFHLPYHTLLAATVGLRNNTHIRDEKVKKHCVLLLRADHGAFSSELYHYDFTVCPLYSLYGIVATLYPWEYLDSDTFTSIIKVCTEAFLCMDCSEKDTLFNTTLQYTAEFARYCGNNGFSVLHSMKRVVKGFL